MKKVLIMALVLLIVIGIGAGFTYNYYVEAVDVDTIYEGISINGIDIGGLTKEEALAKLRAEDTYDDRTIDFAYGDISYSYNYTSLGYEPNYEELIDQAHSYGRTGTKSENFRTVLDLGSNPINLTTSNDSFSNRKINQLVDRLAETLYVQPYDAYYAVEDGEIVVINETNGLELDRQDAISKILQRTSGEPIQLKTKVVEPLIKANQLNFEQANLANASTNYSASIQSRKDNIILSAQILDGTVVLPGQQFSFNNTIGPISRATGFKEATVINDGEYVKGVGGGICQVSTTLYLAASKSDLAIDERHNHSRPVNYVPRGLDAAVAQGLLDLKFTNIYDKPIIIRAKADNDNIEFTIVGASDSMDYEIELESQQTGTLSSSTKEKYSSSKPSGSRETVQSGYAGSTYNSYKVKYKDGKEVSRTKYLSSRYPARNTIVEVGTGD